MKASILKRTVCIVFFAVCLIPTAGMAFDNVELAENRVISGFPAVYDSSSQSFNREYFDELTTYFAEHFAFRPALVELAGEVKYKLLRSPSDSQVVIGKDGWLFLDSTLNDYAGVTLSDDSIEKIAQNTKRACEYISQNGKTPLVIIVPNKNSVYGEYMPKRFGKRSEVSNITLLQERFDEYKVPYVDAQKLLTEGKAESELYLHRDTHWNNTGARLALNGIYRAYGLTDSHTLDDYTLEESHKSDLSAILFPTGDNLEEQRIYPETNKFSYRGRVRSMDEMVIESENENGNGKSILVYRDSFGRAMIPCMAEVFESCTFIRATPYDLKSITEYECDYVLIEIVERNLADLGGMVF